MTHTFLHTRIHTHQHKQQTWYQPNDHTLHHELQPNTQEKVSNIIKESLKSGVNSSRFNENSLSVPLKEAREKFEKEYLSLQLKKFNGNISKTATFVGMERSALHRKLKGLGIKEFN